MSVLDWLMLGLAVCVAIDVLFVAWLVRAAELRELRAQQLREIRPFPYREALGTTSERDQPTRRVA